MPENEPAEIFNVGADDATNGEHEDPTDQNPGDNSSQKQDGVSNTAYDTPATDEEDTTKDHVAGDNSKVSIKVEDVEDEDDANDSDDDADIVIRVGDRYHKCKSKQREDYIPSHGKQQYKQGIIHIQTQEKFCDMSDDAKDSYVLGIIMSRYSFNAGLNRFGIKGQQDFTDELSNIYNIKTFFPVDPKVITKE